MPVQTDVPNGIGSPDDWGLWGSAPDKVAAVGTADGDTSVIYGFSHGRHVVQHYTFSPILGVGDPVNAASITAYAREYQPGNAARAFYLHWNGAALGSNYGETIHLAAPNYGLYSYAAGAATLAAVNGQHGCEMYAVSGTGFEVWVSNIYRTVDYNFGGGGAGTADTQFAHLIGCLVGALIGGGLMLREMSALSRAMGKVRLRKDEYEAAWRAWRAYRHPVWSV